MILVMLLACTGKDDAPTDDSGVVDDSGDTQPVAPLDGVDLGLLAGGVSLPMDWFATINGMLNDGTDGCPAVSGTPDWTEITGSSCTDGGGTTWTGSVTVAEGQFLYNSFGPQQSDGSGTALTGAQTSLPGKGSFGVESDLTAVLTGPDGSFELVYTDHVVDDGLKWLGAEAGEALFDGTVTFKEQELALSGTHTASSSCPDEPDRVATYTGDFGELVFTWTSASCDACPEYSWDYGDGSLCGGE